MSSCSEGKKKHHKTWNQSLQIQFYTVDGFRMKNDEWRFSISMAFGLCMTFNNLNGFGYKFVPFAVRVRLVCGPIRVVVLQSLRACGGGGEKVREKAPGVYCIKKYYPRPQESGKRWHYTLPWYDYCADQIVSNKRTKNKNITTKLMAMGSNQQWQWQSHIQQQCQNYKQLTNIMHHGRPASPPQDPLSTAWGATSCPSSPSPWGRPRNWWRGRSIRMSFSTIPHYPPPGSVQMKAVRGSGDLGKSTGKRGETTLALSVVNRQP